MSQNRLDEQHTAAVPRSWWWIGLVGLLVAASLPVIGRQFRIGQLRCALDGQETDPLRRITVVKTDGSRHTFCCITCTELWLHRGQVVPLQVLVTDEVTGQRLNAGDAYYVRSSVTSNAPTGDRRHVFARRDIADAHATSFQGRVLTGKERPFADLTSPTPAAKVKPGDSFAKELPSN